LHRRGAPITTDQRTARLPRSLQIFTALRHPQYRRYWFGNLAAVSGQQMMWVAQGFLIYKLTDSPLYIGYAGLMTAAPAIVLNLVGGAIADRVNLKALIIVTQAVTGAVLIGLGLITIADAVAPWHILAVAFAIGALQAFSNPARQAIFPHMVDRADLPNAVALNSMVWQGTRIVAPATGGVLIGLFGSGVVFVICGVTFLVFSLVCLSLVVPAVLKVAGANLVREMAEGVRFVFANGLFAFLIGMSFFNSFFGMATMQMFPVFAEDILDIGPSGLGTLYAASGVGSLLGIFLFGALSEYRRRGLLMIGGATLFGGFIVLFALSTWYIGSLVALFCMGIANQLYMVTVQSTLQLQVPDHLRGRVMGLYGMTYSMGPLGALQAGAVASVFGAPAAAALGGLVIAGFTLVVATSNRRVRHLEPTPLAAAAAS
jgi:MFS family permease